MNVLIAAIETAAACLLLFLLCVLSTGGDKRNLRNFSSYPDAVRERIKSIPEYQGKFKDKNVALSFLSNFLLFSALLFLLGLPIRERGFAANFGLLSLIGQGINAFDLLVIDFLWWRNAKRIRFSKIPEKELYRSPKKHLFSFLRAIPMFLLVAALDGWLLTLF